MKLNWQHMSHHQEKQRQFKIEEVEADKVEDEANNMEEEDRKNAWRT